MNDLEFNRRQLLIGTAVAAAAMGTPRVAAAAEPIATAARDPNGGSWGFSLDQERWYTGFRSMKQAIGEANAMLDDDDCTFEVGFCTPDPFHFPEVSSDLADLLADDLTDRRNIERGRFGPLLAAWFYESNYDHEFDGGLEDAIDHSKVTALEEASLVALAASLGRAGVPYFVSDVPVTDPELIRKGLDRDFDQTVLDRVAKDPILDQDIIASYRAWIAENDIEQAPRTLSTAQIHTITATFDEDRMEHDFSEPVPEQVGILPTPGM